MSTQLYQVNVSKFSFASGRIIISPDGKYFPFEALVINTQPLTYFLEDHAVSYTYSARYLLNNFTVNPALNSNTFMGFAPVQYASALPDCLAVTNHCNECEIISVIRQILFERTHQKIIF